MRDLRARAQGVMAEARNHCGSESRDKTRPESGMDEHERSFPALMMARALQTPSEPVAGSAKNGGGRGFKPPMRSFNLITVLQSVGARPKGDGFAPFQSLMARREARTDKNMRSPAAHMGAQSHPFRRTLLRRRSDPPDRARPQPSAPPRPPGAQSVRVSPDPNSVGVRAITSAPRRHWGFHRADIGPRIARPRGHRGRRARLVWGIAWGRRWGVVSRRRRIHRGWIHIDRRRWRVIIRHGRDKKWHAKADPDPGLDRRGNEKRDDQGHSGGDAEQPLHGSPENALHGTHSTRTGHQNHGPGPVGRRSPACVSVPAAS